MQFYAVAQGKYATKGAGPQEDRNPTGGTKPHYWGECYPNGPLMGLTNDRSGKQEYDKGSKPPRSRRVQFYAVAQGKNTAKDMHKRCSSWRPQGAVLRHTQGASMAVEAKNAIQAAPRKHGGQGLQELQSRSRLESMAASCWGKKYNLDRV